MEFILCVVPFCASAADVDAPLEAGVLFEVESTFEVVIPPLLADFDGLCFPFWL